MAPRRLGVAAMSAGSGHPVVSRAQWLLARKALLAQEKEMTRLRDRINAARRALPWVRVEKSYTFETQEGPITLEALFDGRSQLLVQHFMFAPDWDQGCVGCSFTADHVDAARQHFEHNDVSYVAISRASPLQIDAFRQRMGWRFRWVSSQHSDFNYDFNVSFRPEELASGKVYYNYAAIDAGIEELSGFSVFFRRAPGEVLHTYSAYARGTELLDGTYMFMDLTPKGRNEHGASGDLTDWVRHHDRYGAGGHVDASGRYREAAAPCCDAAAADITATGD
jgi:predicted dithiol-disulfide oxidoreductase (DUF899 family)